MRVRVVCGFGVTMASFSPTSAFNRVLLPALGRPMMETKPETTKPFYSRGRKGRKDVGENIITKRRRSTRGSKNKTWITANCFLQAVCLVWGWERERLTRT